MVKALRSALPKEMMDEAKHDEREPQMVTDVMPSASESRRCSDRTGGCGAAGGEMRRRSEEDEKRTSLVREKLERNFVESSFVLVGGGSKLGRLGHSLRRSS